MRIEARLETVAGALRPVLFFPDDVERDKTIGAYSDREGHVSASRAYMRQCKKPQTREEYAAVFRMLAAYYGDATRYAEIR